MQHLQSNIYNLTQIVMLVSETCKNYDSESKYILVFHLFFICISNIVSLVQCYNNGGLIIRLFACINVNYETFCISCVSL